MAVIIPTLTAGVVALYGIRHRLRRLHYVLIVSVTFASCIFFQGVLGQVLIEVGWDSQTGFGPLLAGIGWMSALALLAYSVVHASVTLIRRKA